MVGKGWIGRHGSTMRSRPSGREDDARDARNGRENTVPASRRAPIGAAASQISSGEASLSTTDTIATVAALIAFYGAVVATGVAFVQIRQWMMSGPRLSISIMANAKLFGGTDEEEAKEYVAVTVVNRGDAPTTITHLAVTDRPRFFDQFFRVKRQTYLVPNPQFPGSAPVIPHILQPGHQWTGMGARRPDIPELIKLLDSGKAFALVQASHADKPTLKRIPKRREILKDAHGI